MKKNMIAIKEKMLAAVDRRAIATVSALGLVGVTTAGAQEAGIQYAPMVTAVTNGMTGVLNNAGPLLFGLLALIGGFYFVWGRIRSLW